MASAPDDSSLSLDQDINRIFGVGREIESQIFYSTIRNFTNWANWNQLHNNSTKCILWFPPVGNMSKVNFDGAVSRPQQAAGYIVIIGDSEGRTVGALSLWIPLPQTVEEVEVLACCWAIIFAAEIGIPELIVEGDAKITIDMLHSERCYA